jgi:hypothetical protein
MYLLDSPFCGPTVCCCMCTQTPTMPMLWNWVCSSWFLRWQRCVHTRTGVSHFYLCTAHTWRMAKMQLHPKAKAEGVGSPQRLR